MDWVDLLGWGGSALLVYSLLQARVLRFRTLNLVACVVLVVFNAVVGVWPMVAMNVVLAAINTWFIVRLLRERHDEAAFAVIEVGTRDTWLEHVLAGHAADIARVQPVADWSPDAPGSHAFVLVKGDETVGVVLLSVEGRQARIALDYVTPRYRDFSPGEFVWRRSGLLHDLGVRRVVTAAGGSAAYYRHVGFERSGDRYVLEVGAAA